MTQAELSAEYGAGEGDLDGGPTMEVAEACANTLGLADTSLEGADNDRC